MSKQPVPYRRGLTLLVLAVLGLMMRAEAAADEPRVLPRLGPAHDTRLRALVVPREHATIASRLQATIKSIGPENGERFKKGGVLVEFDCGSIQAELKRAIAIAEAAETTLQVKTELAAAGSMAKLQAVLASAEAKKARAEVVVAQERAAGCVIRAPYDGRVVRRVANAYETVNFRDPLIEIVNDLDVEVRVFVPSVWLRTLREGARFRIEIDETGEAVDAHVIALGAWIDNVSQLVEIRAECEPSRVRLVAGMSGKAVFVGFE